MNKHPMKTWLYALVGTVVLCVGFGRPAASQDAYPAKPIAMLVGFSAGGPTDIVARLLAKGMAEALHVPVIVENKPGAAGNIAAVQAKQAKPDGYTVFFAGANHTINVGMFPDLPYHPVEDFIPIAIAAEAPSVMVARPGFPANNARELFAQLRQNPGKYSIATAGGGQLQVLQFKQQTATTLIDVPYKGAARHHRLGGRARGSFLGNAGVGTAPDQSGSDQGLGRCGTPAHQAAARHPHV